MTSILPDLRKSNPSYSISAEKPVAYQASKQPKLRKWSEQEINKFNIALLEIGIPGRKNSKATWEDVADSIKTRDAKQCKNRFVHIQSDYSRPYSKKEFDFIVHAVNSCQFIKLKKTRNEIDWIAITEAFNEQFSQSVTNFYIANIYHNAIRAGRIKRPAFLDDALGHRPASKKVLAQASDVKQKENLSVVFSKTVKSSQKKRESVKKRKITSNLGKTRKSKKTSTVKSRLLAACRRLSLANKPKIKL